MKGMTLGQYYPADSVLHRMDPRIKILCTIAFIVASFLCVNFLPLSCWSRLRLR